MHNERCTSGSEGGPEKPIGRKADRALRFDPTRISLHLHGPTGGSAGTTAGPECRPQSVHSEQARRRAYRSRARSFFPPLSRRSASTAAQTSHRDWPSKAGRPQETQRPAAARRRYRSRSATRRASPAGLADGAVVGSGLVPAAGAGSRCHAVTPALAAALPREAALGLRVLAPVDLAPGAGLGAAGAAGAAHPAEDWRRTSCRPPRRAARRPAGGTPRSQDFARSGSLRGLPSARSRSSRARLALFLFRAQSSQTVRSSTGERTPYLGHKLAARRTSVRFLNRS